METSSSSVRRNRSVGESLGYVSASACVRQCIRDTRKSVRVRLYMWGLRLHGLDEGLRPT